MNSLQRAVAAWHMWRTPTAVLRELREGGLEALDKDFDGLDEAVQRDLSEAAADLDEAGVRALLFGDDDYPLRLTALRSPPPILLAIGETSLLDRRAIGVCGSRSASAEGLEAARTLAQSLVSNGFVTVAGNAAGVDNEAQRGAFDAGGTVISVIPEGIKHLRRSGDDFDEGRLLVLSQFPPGQPWSVGGAMARNGVIAALSEALVVIEAGEKGGTLAAGETALAMGRPVLALEFDAGTPAGNAILIRHGATPVRTPRAVIDLVMAKPPSGEPEPAEDQLTLTL